MPERAGTSVPRAGTGTRRQALPFEELSPGEPGSSSILLPFLSCFSLLGALLSRDTVLLCAASGAGAGLCSTKSCPGGRSAETGSLFAEGRGCCSFHSTTEKSRKRDTPRLFFPFAPLNFLKSQPTNVAQHMRTRASRTKSSWRRRTTFSSDGSRQSDEQEAAARSLGSGRKRFVFAKTSEPLFPSRPQKMNPPPLPTHTHKTIACAVQGPGIAAW